MALIYIVEDDNDIREIEAYALKCGGFEVEEFECARDLYKKTIQQVPDLFILDVMLPDEDGIQIISKLKGNTFTRSIPIILVTAKSSELDKVKGLDSGADDYITKPFGIMELISRVKALLRRTSGVVESKIFECGLLKMDNERHHVTINGELCELTYKEYELLKLLLRNKDIVMAREIIMGRVWETDFEGESRTLDMHIKTLRQKIRGTGVRIRTVRNVGYVLENDN